MGAMMVGVYVLNFLCTIRSIKKKSGFGRLLSQGFAFDSCVPLRQACKPLQSLFRVVCEIDSASCARLGQLFKAFESDKADQLG